jgi:hypothetical protein
MIPSPSQMWHTISKSDWSRTEQTHWLESHNRCDCPALVPEAVNRAISSRNRSNSAYRSRSPPLVFLALVILALGLASWRFFIPINRPRK